MQQNHATQLDNYCNKLQWSSVRDRRYQEEMARQSGGALTRPLYTVADRVPAHWWDALLPHLPLLA